MVRDIRFRGKRVDCDEWVTGCYVEGDSTGEMKTFIIQDDFCFEVYPDSVGQYTGLKDINHVEIFEGDIVSYYGRRNCVVTFDDGAFWLCTEFEKLGLGFLREYEIDRGQITVVGNSYD